jgi:hypothetical protein
MHSQGARAGSVQAVWLRKWDLETHPAITLYIAAYTPGLVHLRACAADIAYVAQPKSDDTIKHVRMRPYRALHTMASAATLARPCLV